MRTCAWPARDRPERAGPAGRGEEDELAAQIHINARFLTQPLTGVQRYSWELLRAWDELIGEGEIQPSGRLDCLAPPDAPRAQPWTHLPVRAVGRRGGNLWEQLDLALAARGGLLFSPGNIGPYFHPNQVVTLHDASVFAFPEAYSFTFRLKYRLVMRRMGQVARRIISVSQFSRRELARWCGIPEERIAVVWEGKEHIQRAEADAGALERMGLSGRPYFVAVGSNSAHKNFQLVLDAFERLGRSDIDLAIIGGDFSKVFQSQTYRLPANARRVGYVQDGELKALYQGALGLVFSSLYEGFGIPPLEAMACGCPVISSSAASLREVGGEAVLYFDPRDAGALAGQMERLASDSAMRDQLRHAGLAQAQKFSWRQAGRETWRIIEPLLG